MKLNRLLEEMEGMILAGDPQVEITGIRYDSRRVRPGDLFFALPGASRDGRRFVDQAVAAGAAAVAAGGEGPERGPVRVRVDDPRRALALAAAAFFGHPSRMLQVVGVTGTNGKTTTTTLLESVFRAAGVAAGRIGTTGYQLADETRPAPFTTPEAPELQGLLAEMVERGIGGVAIELSSHALVQRRCFALECDVAVFTNLSRDHLDYHHTLDQYLDAKLRLFDGRNRAQRGKPATAVINADDGAAPRVIEAARRGGMAVKTFGRAAGADLGIGRAVPGPAGLGCELIEDGRPLAVELGLFGRFNAWNAAAAYAAARALAIPSAIAVRGLEALRGVPGRLERIDEGQPFGVVVDYAHTPEALELALAEVREHARGRVLVVFGCGGDRDRGKRPLMGRVAAERSDEMWITNDNPRSEAPQAIAAEIAAGAAGAQPHQVLDRRRAIGEALRHARSGDLVLIAGKGHETTQTIGDRVLPFDDREVARALLRERSGEWR